MNGIDLCQYPCKNKVRCFHIEAIQIPIVYNKYGDHDPNGLLYVLKKDAERVKECAVEKFKQEIPQPCKEVKPLVLRVNLGDEVRVKFSHSLDRELSIHVQGMTFDVNFYQSSGMLYTGYSVRSGKPERSHRGRHFPLSFISSFS